MENGEWKMGMENGEWKMRNGERRNTFECASLLITHFSLLISNCSFSGAF